MSRHANVPVFVPHMGCPHRCSFCNQHVISGSVRPPGPEQVKTLCEQARKSLGKRMYSAQLAFFGGSFTAIDRGYRLALLEAARPFVGEAGFAGIRVSTRPDCIDEGDLAELGSCGVTAVELGVQSMCDKVLAANNRGHTAADTRRAAALIKGAGMELGLQMMTGLHGDDDEIALETAQQIIGLSPGTVRVYPTVVLEGTGLARLWRDGTYMPQTLEQAVELGARLLELFDNAGIPVIRLGLHDQDGLLEEVLAGPHHPALRELCEGRLMLDRALAALRQSGIASGSAVLRAHPRCISRMVGQRRCNIRRLESAEYRVHVVRDADVGYLVVKALPGP